MKYYISDLHLFHENAIKFDNRPFSSIPEMHDAILKNWNDRVTNGDYVYILGDISMRGKNEDLIAFVAKLKGRKVLVEEPPRAVLTPAREKVRQNGRRMKEPEEPMFTITATDRHGVIYHGRIRRLTPRECLRLQGYRDGQISKMEKETSDNQLYKQAGNGVTVNVIEAIGRNLKAVDEEIQSGSPVPEAKGG